MAVGLATLIETAGERQLNAKSPQQEPSICKVEL